MDDYFKVPPTPEGPLEYAIKTKQYNVAKYLLDKNMVDKKNAPLILLWVQPENYQDMIDFFKIDLTTKIDKAGSSILHVATSKRNMDLVDFLLKNNFDVNTLDDYNHTALFYAVIPTVFKIDWESPVIEDETIAKLNLGGRGIYPSQFHPLVTFGDGIFCGMLVDAGINVNQQNKAGWTVLHFLVATYKTPNWSLANILDKIAKDINLDLKTNYGRTAMDIHTLME